MCVQSTPRLPPRRYGPLPAKRLPWYKVWAEHIDHAKIAGLTDRQYRTWHYLLAKASQQPERWRFASIKHAAAITHSSIADIEALISAGLIDTTLPEGSAIVIHNAPKWQDKYPSDYCRNAAPTLREHSANTPLITAGTLPQSLTRDTELDRNPNGLLKEADPEEDTRDADTLKAANEQASEMYDMPAGNGHRQYPADGIPSRASMVFDQLYGEAYPTYADGRRGSRSAAWKAFVQNVSPDEYGDVVEAARVYGASQRVRDGKIMALGTWLESGWATTPKAIVVDLSDDMHDADGKYHPKRVVI